MNQEEKKVYDQIVGELESKGISHNSDYTEVGVGDVVESVLQQFGITEERFKTWFGLQECNCAKRKKWLNGLFSWRWKKKNKF